MKSEGPSQSFSVLTLDVGTSSVRASVYDEGGRPVSGLRAWRSLPVQFRDGGEVELDADEAVRAVVDAVEEILSRIRGNASTRLRLRAVAVSTFWHSLIGVDDDGRAVTPVSLWADRRAADQARALRSTLDADEVVRRTGCPIHTSYPVVRILWLKEDRPEQFVRVRHFLAFGDYLMLCLFGQAVTSPSLASGSGLFDLRRGAWDDELARKVGVRADQLPDVHPSPLFEGVLRPAYRDRLSELQGVPWLLPIADGACDNVGAGCVTPSRVALMVGSSGATRVVDQRPVADHLPPPPGLWTYLVRDETAITGGSLSNGGKLLDWFARTFRSESEHAGDPNSPAVGDGVRRPTLVDEALRDREPDAHGLTVLPMWAGERSPGWHLGASGVIRGLRLTHTPADILQAMVESIAYRFALIHERLRTGALIPDDYEVVATGSALIHSPGWMQTMADVLGVPVSRAPYGDTSSRGAALLALEALGQPGADEGASRAPVGAGARGPGERERYEPNSARHRRYREGLARHQELYAQMTSDMG